jgi:hypothetical protein
VTGNRKEHFSSLLACRFIAACGALSLYRMIGKRQYAHRAQQKAAALFGAPVPAKRREGI